MVKPDHSRYIYLYAPSIDDKRRYENLAENAGVPLSKYLLGVIEEALAEKTDVKPRAEIVKELQTLREENRRLTDEIKLKDIVLEKYENELQRYRNAPFLDMTFEGIRQHDPELIRILKRGVIDGYELLEELNIGPTDAKSIQAISHQLEQLEGYGLITKVGGGWRSIG